MAPLHETYVPVPEFKHTKSPSKRILPAKDASSTVNSQDLATPRKKSKSKSKNALDAETGIREKTKAEARLKAKAEAKTKTKAKDVLEEPAAKRQKSRQDPGSESAVGFQEPTAPKSRLSKAERSSSKRDNAGRRKEVAVAANTKKKSSSKSAENPSRKFLSAELVTISDDEDSDDGGIDDDDDRQDDRNGEGRGVSSILKLGRSSQVNGVPGNRHDSSTKPTSTSSSEASSEEDRNGIRVGGDSKNKKKSSVLARANGSTPKRAGSPSLNTSSSSDSGGESTQTHRNKVKPRNGTAKEKKRNEKNLSVSNPQPKADDRPSKRAKNSSPSDTSISSGKSKSASSRGDKMDVDSYETAGIGPSAQPESNMNSTMPNGIGNKSGSRQTSLKKQAGTPLLNGNDKSSGSSIITSSESGSESGSESESNSSTSSSQSGSASNDDIDISHGKHIPTTPAAKITSKLPIRNSTPIPTPTSRKALSQPTRTVSATAEPTATPKPHTYNNTPIINTAQNLIVTPRAPPDSFSHSSLSTSTGKQIWHITLPANVPITSIRNIPLSAITSFSTSSASSTSLSSTKIPPKIPITTHDGAEYVLDRGSAAEEHDAHVLIATDDKSNTDTPIATPNNSNCKKGYKRLKRNVDAVWHVRLAPKMPLPSLNHGQKDRGFKGLDGGPGRPEDSSGDEGEENQTESEDSDTSSDSSEPQLRPLPAGLKMRWLPSGCS